MMTHGIVVRSGIVAFLCVVFPLLGMLGKSCWIFDLVSHFRIQYVVCLLVCGIIFLLTRRIKTSVLCWGAALLLIAPYAHYFFPPGKTPPSPSAKLISFNVNTANQNYAGVLDFILSEDADVVLLLEVNDKWIHGLKNLKSKYPYQLSHPQDDNFGITVLSKHPFEKGEMRAFGKYDLPYVDITVSIQGASYRIIGIHTLPPMGGSYSQERNSELLEISNSIEENKPRNIIMMGDFNLTPFSRYYPQILDASGLKDSAIGYGLVPTWMRFIPVFAIPIDHVLVSKEIQIQDHRILGHNLGSDHNPVIVTIN